MCAWHFDDFFSFKFFHYFKCQFPTCLTTIMNICTEDSTTRARCNDEWPAAGDADLFLTLWKDCLFYVLSSCLHVSCCYIKYWSFCVDCCCCAPATKKMNRIATIYIHKNWSAAFVKRKIWRFRRRRKKKRILFASYTYWPWGLRSILTLTVGSKRDGVNNISQLFTMKF